MNPRNHRINGGRGLSEPRRAYFPPLLTPESSVSSEPFAHVQDQLQIGSPTPFWHPSDRQHGTLPVGAQVSYQEKVGCDTVRVQTSEFGVVEIDAGLWDDICG